MKKGKGKERIQDPDRAFLWSLLVDCKRELQLIHGSNLAICHFAAPLVTGRLRQLGHRARVSKGYFITWDGKESLRHHWTSLDNWRIDLTLDQLADAGYDYPVPYVSQGDPSYLTRRQWQDHQGGE